MLNLDEYLITKRGEWSDETYLKYRRILGDLVRLNPSPENMSLAQFSVWSHSFESFAQFGAGFIYAFVRHGCRLALEYFDVCTDAHLVQ